MGYFVKYAFHRLKERDSSLPPVKYTAWIQECSGGWQKLSEEEKKVSILVKYDIGSIY